MWNPHFLLFQPFAKIAHNQCVAQEKAVYKTSYRLSFIIVEKCVNEAKVVTKSTYNNIRVGRMLAYEGKGATHL